MDNLKYTKISTAYSTILEAIGEDTSREGLLKTPHRVAKSYEFLTEGYSMSLESIINGAIFNEDIKNMIIVKNIEFYSLCEHHILPFFGKAHVAYIPDGKIIGISKIPRIVNLYSRRLQVQERLTNEIASALMKTLQPKGVAVSIEAKHMCMMMRGIEKQDSTLVTSSMQGQFNTDQDLKKEFLTSISQK